jgi:type IV fimbrial biogenesis protein FimT
MQPSNSTQEANFTQQPSHPSQPAAAHPRAATMPTWLLRAIETQGTAPQAGAQPWRRRRTDQPGIQTQSGFTIVELMFVLAIIAVLCAVSLPSIGAMLSGGQSRSAQNSLITALNLARSTAISHQADVVMCPSSDAKHCTQDFWWHSGWIVFQDLNHDNKPEPNEPIINIAQAQSGVAIVTSAGREHVTYRSEGTSGGTNVTFTLCDRRGSKYASTVVVSNPGRARTGKPNPDEAATACAGLH